MKRKLKTFIFTCAATLGTCSSFVAYPAALSKDDQMVAENLSGISYQEKKQMQETIQGLYNEAKSDSNLPS